jgi:hypothetical protein
MYNPPFPFSPPGSEPKAELITQSATGSNGA